MTSKDGKDSEEKSFVKALDTLGNAVDLNFSEFVKKTITDPTTNHEQTLYVRQSLADYVTNLKFVQPWHESPKRVSYLSVANYRFDFTNVQMEPILGLPFLGTTSFVVKNLYYTDGTGTHKVLTAKQYVRVVREYVYPMLRVMAIAEDMQARAVPWVGVVKAYLSKQVKFLMLKSFYFYIQRKRIKLKKTGEVKEYTLPELRLYFVQNSLGFLGRGKQYLFELYMYVPRTFYVTKLAATTPSPEEQRKYVEEIKSYVKKAVEEGG